jgi:hypothetical protein
MLIGAGALVNRGYAANAIDGGGRRPVAIA